MSSLSAEFPYKSQYLEVHGSKMHYIEEGKGDPILFLHGNPTSSYLWRNVIPHLTGSGRCIAPDLIGMGKSDKPEIEYRFVDHAHYLDAFIQQLDLKNITLVLHDWGSGLGFHFAARHENLIKGIAFMEAIVKPPTWADANLPQELLFKWLRNQRTGGKTILEKNFFVRRMLPLMTKRKLSAEVKAVYAEPYPDAKSRIPTAVWPREIPFDGQPTDVFKLISNYNLWLKASKIPKLLLYAKPGAIIKGEKAARVIQSEFPNTTLVYIGRGMHFVQEENPNRIGKAIAGWMETLP